MWTWINEKKSWNGLKRHTFGLIFLQSWTSIVCHPISGVFVLQSLPAIHFLDHWLDSKWKPNSTYESVNTVFEMTARMRTFTHGHKHNSEKLLRYVPVYDSVVCRHVNRGIFEHWKYPIGWLQLVPRVRTSGHHFDVSKSTEHHHYCCCNALDFANQIRFNYVIGRVELNIQTKTSVPSGMASAGSTHSNGTTPRQLHRIQTAVSLPSHSLVLLWMVRKHFNQHAYGMKHGHFDCTHEWIFGFSL